MCPGLLLARDWPRSLCGVIPLGGSVPLCMLPWVQRSLPPSPKGSLSQVLAGHAGLPVSSLSYHTAALVSPAPALLGPFRESPHPLAGMARDSHPRSRCSACIFAGLKPKVRVPVGSCFGLPWMPGCLPAAFPWFVFHAPNPGISPSSLWGWESNPAAFPLDQPIGLSLCCNDLRSQSG